MRMGVQATILFAAMLFGTYGCKGSSASAPVDSEPSSGGEVPMGGGEAVEGEPGPATRGKGDDARGKPVGCNASRAVPPASAPDDVFEGDEVVRRRRECGGVRR